MKVFQILVLILSVIAFTSAQTTTLSGKIYDQNGAVIVNAKIQLKDFSNKVYSSFTNEDGYRIEIPEGVYSIEIASNGFKKYGIKKYWIASKFNNKMFLDVVLETGNEVIEDKIYPEKIKRKNNNKQ